MRRAVKTQGEIKGASGHRMESARGIWRGKPVGKKTSRKFRAEAAAAVITDRPTLTPIGVASEKYLPDLGEHDVIST